MEILYRILILLLIAIVGARTSTSAPIPPTDDQTFESETVIESVEALVMESFPPTIMLNVSGYQADGCEYPVTIRQSRTDNRIDIDIFRVMPISVMCSMQIIPYSGSIVVEGTFELGTYTIDVNGIVISVEL